MGYEYGSHRVGAKRASHIAEGHARGGKVKHSDEAADRKLFGKMMAEHEAKEGGDEAPPGPKSRERFDRPVRGYKHGGNVEYTGDPERKTIPRKGNGPVTVVVQAPQPAPAVPAGPPPIPPAALAAMAAPPPPPGAGPGGPPGLPPGGPPIRPPGAPVMAKRGGRIFPHTNEAKGATERAVQKAHNKKGYSSGGRVHTYPKMTAGGDSGEGRLERAKAYGRKAKERD